MGDMELWRKSNRGWGIRFGLERGWCCLGRVCGIIELDNLNLQERINIAPLVDLKERGNSDELYKKWKISNA